MKTLILLLGMTTAVFAVPDLTKGYWFSDEAEVQLVFEGLTYKVRGYGWDGVKGEDGFSRCRIISWPLNSALAKGECENGVKHDIEIGPNSLHINGYPFSQMLDSPG